MYNSVVYHCNTIQQKLSGLSLMAVNKDELKQCLKVYLPLLKQWQGKSLSQIHFHLQ